jgi:hypothetical protein
LTQKQKRRKAERKTKQPLPSHIFSVKSFRKHSKPRWDMLSPFFFFLSLPFVRALFGVESPERMRQLADDLALVSFHFTKPRPLHELSCQLTADAPTRVSTLPAA